MKITDSKGVSSVGKSKKSNKASKTDGASFDSMVDAAGGVEQTSVTGSIDAVNGIYVDEEASNSYSVPDDAEGRSGYLLESLEELERDILLGKTSDAVVKLKHALESQAGDIDKISPELKEILNEIEMRAAVEVAKAEEE